MKNIVNYSRRQIAARLKDVSTQIRASVDPEVISKYALSMKAPKTRREILPLVVFVGSNKKQYLADGFQRGEGMIKAGLKSFPTEV